MIIEYTMNRDARRRGLMADMVRRKVKGWMEIRDVE